MSINQIKTEYIESGCKFSDKNEKWPVTKLLRTLKNEPRVNPIKLLQNCDKFKS